MTIVITREIEQAYEAYLNESVDCFIDGTPILRRSTYPYNQEHGTAIGLVTFAAGFQAAKNCYAPAPAPAAKPFDISILWAHKGNVGENGYKV